MIRNIFSHEALYQREVAQQLVNRKFDTGTSQVLSFEKERLPGIDLTGAWLHMGYEDFQSHEDMRAQHEEVVEDAIRNAEAYQDYWDPEASGGNEPDFEAQYCQTWFSRAEMPFAILENVQGDHAYFPGANLCFASLRKSSLRYANFEGALTASTDFEGADIARARFTITPSLLTANFAGAKNVETARFFLIVDGVRKQVLDVAVDGKGCLVPAEKKSTAELPHPYSVRFKDIYEKFKPEADLMRSGLEEVISKAHEAAAAPSAQDSILRFMERNRKEAAATAATPRP